MLFANKRITNNLVFFANVSFSNSRVEMEKVFVILKRWFLSLHYCSHESPSDALEPYFTF